MDIKLPSTHTFTATDQEHRIRIDLFLTQKFPDYSRSHFQRLLKQDCVTINNKTVSKNAVVQEGDLITISFPAPKPLFTDKPTPEGLDIPVLFENEDFIIINKPAGLLVHAPSTYSDEFTLVDWLIKHFASIKNVGDEKRPGIVHRLDKDTSGLMIVTLNNKAHTHFCDMFKHKEIQKTYLAAVQGHPEKKQLVDFAIKRDAVHRNKMTYKDPTGRASQTMFTVIEYFETATLLEAKPLTGRTHQIRVHCAAIGHPIIGDSVYGKKSKLIKRQALHAYALEFLYKKKNYSFTQDPPQDFADLINKLRA